MHARPVYMQGYSAQEMGGMELATLLPAPYAQLHKHWIKV